MPGAEAGVPRAEAGVARAVPGGGQRPAAHLRPQHDGPQQRDVRRQHCVAGRMAVIAIHLKKNTVMLNPYCLVIYVPIHDTETLLLQSRIAKY